MRTNVLIFQAILLLFVFGACQKEQQSDSTDVYGFTFYHLSPAAAGSIDYENKTIVVHVPFTTDVSKLTPSILLHPNANVSPLSDVEMDFTNPVVYTVTAQDGTKREYTVTVIKKEADYVIDFESINTGISGYFTGPDLGVSPVTVNLYGIDCQVYYGNIQELGSSFSNTYNSTWMAWSGFAISRLHDKNTPGYSNEGSVYADGGAEGSSQFAVVYAPEYATPITQFSFPTPKKVYSVQIANSVYAYLSMKNGDQFSAPFKEGDYMKVLISGKNAMGETTKTMEVYMADYREGKRWLMDDWNNINIEELGTVKSIEFKVISNQMGAPNYFCIDKIRAMNVNFGL